MRAREKGKHEKSVQGHKMARENELVTKELYSKQAPIHIHTSYFISVQSMMRQVILGLKNFAYAEAVIMCAGANETADGKWVGSAFVTWELGFIHRSCCEVH